MSPTRSMKTPTRSLRSRSRSKSPTRRSMVPKEAWASSGVVDRLNTGAFGEQGTVLSLYNTPRYNKDLDITGIWLRIFLCPANLQMNYRKMTI